MPQRKKQPSPEASAAAAALGKLGGQATRASQTKAQRSENARRAVAVRWKKYRAALRTLGAPR